jgi:hypothetical protein
MSGIARAGVAKEDRDGIAALFGRCRGVVVGRRENKLTVSPGHRQRGVQHRLAEHVFYAVE